MTRGDVYSSLRQLYRKSEYRRFRAKNRNNRYAEFLGFGPSGAVIGWYEGGTDELLEFDPEEQDWTELVTYV